MYIIHLGRAFIIFIEFSYPPHSQGILDYRAQILGRIQIQGRLAVSIEAHDLIYTLIKWISSYWPIGEIRLAG